MLLIHVIMIASKKLRVPLSANSSITRQNKPNNFN